MKLSKLLRGASPASEAQPRRRRRAPRADGPRTIIPIDADATPSWLHTAPADASPFEMNVDAARERLRRAIPPVADDE
ncbi:MAG TPA: hypothetical protein VGM33_19270 [Baekduia sp.]